MNEMRCNIRTSIPRSLAFLSPTPIGSPVSSPLNSLCKLHCTSRTDIISSPPRRRCAHIVRRPVDCIAEKDVSVSVISDTVVRLPSQTGRIDVPLRVDSLGGRLRRISCGVEIDEPASRVWKVLTSYERNSDYIPNIISVEVRLDDDGTKLLDQVGILSNKLRIRSRIVMRIMEDRPDWRVSFTLKQGRDFVRFDGTYQLTETSDKSCRISYEIVVQPIAFYPVSLVERKIAKEVPNMLAAIREEATFGNFVPFQ